MALHVTMTKCMCYSVDVLIRQYLFILKNAFCHKKTHLRKI